MAASNNKAEDALKKVTALDGVRAAFVFDQYFMVPARSVPEEYGNDVLKRIATQLQQMAALSWEAGAVTKEYRLIFDRYSVYCRAFGEGYFLVVFMEQALDAADFRQPINLAVLVLEKGLREAEESVPTTGMSQMAALAEKSIRAATENDESFAGMARRRCEDFLGSLGREIVENGIEDEVLVLPVISEADMDRLIAYIIPRVPHPVIHRILEEDLEDLKRVALKQAE